MGRRQKTHYPRMEVELADKTLLPPRRSVYVLPGLTGGHIHGLQRIWIRIMAQAGLDDVRLHDLRHTVGSLWHLAGLTQRQIEDLLGHRQLSTTARYINSADEHKRETVDAWGAEVTRLVVPWK